MSVERKSVGEKPVTYKYARWGIIATATCMIPIYLLWVWIIATTERTWLRVLLALGVRLGCSPVSYDNPSSIIKA